MLHFLRRAQNGKSVVVEPGDAELSRDWRSQPVRVLNRRIKHHLIVEFNPDAHRPAVGSAGCAMPQRKVDLLAGELRIEG